MFRKMNSNDRSYHASASDQAVISEDEDFPVMMVVDGNRIEVYWTDDELDTHNWSRTIKMPQSIGLALDTVIRDWIGRGAEVTTVYALLGSMLEEMGFEEL